MFSTQPDRLARPCLASGVDARTRLRSAALLALLLALAGCKTRAVETIAGPNADVSVALVNPTTCSACDPFAGVSTLRVDIVDPGTADVLYTDSFPWPGGVPALPDLTGFGVVRVEMYGLAGNRVVSAGRTAPFAVKPEKPVTLPMLFLPANQAVPLTGDLYAERSRHVSFTRPDGRVALLGGVDPRGTSRFNSVELFDPATFTFSLDTTLAAAPVFPAVTTDVDGDLLLVGGESAGGSRETTTFVYSVEGEGAQGVATPQQELPEPRSRGCVARVDQKGVVMGGASGDVLFEVMRFGADTWEFTRAQTAGLDDAAVQGCIGLEDGRIFVLGDEGGQTGFFYFNTDETLGFDAIASGHGDQFVSGATLALLGNGHVWEVGGATSNGAARAQTWDFRPEEASFSVSTELMTPRIRPDVAPWIVPDTEAVGCGWTESGLAQGTGTVEIVGLDGSAGVVVQLDRERPGCGMSVLPDGSLLVTGGFDVNDSGQLGAVVIVPAI